MGSASAATRSVDDSGWANFTRIPDAISVACAEDTIIVYSGTYIEDIEVDKSWGDEKRVHHTALN